MGGLRRPCELFSAVDRGVQTRRNGNTVPLMHLRTTSFFGSGRVFFPFLPDSPT